MRLPFLTVALVGMVGLLILGVLFLFISKDNLNYGYNQVQQAGSEAVTISRSETTTHDSHTHPYDRLTNGAVLDPVTVANRATADVGAIKPR